MKRIFDYLAICKELIVCDLRIFRQEMVGRSIDILIWVAINIFIMGYIMPFFGLTNFGVLQFAGLVASTGVVDMYHNIHHSIDDFEGDRIINYLLTLPVPSWMIIMSRGVYYAIDSFLMTLIMLPIGKLLLWNQLNLGSISYLHLLCALTVQNIFYAACVLWVSGYAQPSTMRHVWRRIIFPLWFLGGYQFSWSALSQAVPWAAYLILLNPMIYITEGMRVAFLGQPGYLNFYCCMAALGLFTLFALWHGLARLKRRLDYV